MSKVNPAFGLSRLQRRSRFYQTTVLAAAMALSAGCTTAPALNELKIAPVSSLQTQSQPAQKPVAQASTSGTQIGRRVSRPDRLIARDLVDALMQIDHFHPRRSSIRLPRDKTSFDRTLAEQLVSSGYTVERVKAGSGRGVLLNTVLKEAKTVNGNRYTFILAIDRLAMKRSYVLNNDFVAPVSSLFVRGVEPSRIRLSDDKFYEKKAI